jgi:low temperature requirement protein LtrA
VRGFRVSARHFAERFGLIVIIALGESIVAIGAGVSGELDAGIVVAAAFGLIVSCALWWAYFDVWAQITETRFRQARGHSRILIARDVYSYLHLPMTAGVVLIALGIKKTITDVDEPLKIAPDVALFGGIALYYAGHVGVRWRMTRTLFRGRLVGLALSVALIPLAAEVDALLALGLAAALTSAVILYEVMRYAEDRRRIRAESR